MQDMHPSVVKTPFIGFENSNQEQNGRETDQTNVTYHGDQLDYFNIK